MAKSGGDPFLMGDTDGLLHESGPDQLTLQIKAKENNEEEVYTWEGRRVSKEDYFRLACEEPSPEPLGQLPKNPYGVRHNPRPQDLSGMPRPPWAKK